MPHEEVLDFTKDQLTRYTESHLEDEEPEKFCVCQCEFCNRQDHVYEKKKVAAKQLHERGWRVIGSDHWQMSGSACPSCVETFVKEGPEALEDAPDRSNTLTDVDV